MRNDDNTELIELLIDAWRTLHKHNLAPEEDIYYELERRGQLTDEMREATL